MAFIRRYRLRRPAYRRRRAVARRIPLYARPSIRRSVKVASPTFTETYRMGTVIQDSVTGNTTGIWTVRMLDLPQIADYTALYNQYCIKRAVLTIVPAYNSYDSENPPTTAFSSVTVPRLVYAINDSAQQPVPGTENDVLTDNGCKIRMMTRPVSITFRPVAQVGLSASTGGFVSESKRQRFLSLNNPEIAHAGVSFSFTQASQNTVNNDPLATVYCKLTFTLRDPK